MLRRHLAGLLLAFCLLAAIYSLTTPLFEAPDEPWHYAYVRWLAEGHGLPRLDDDASGAYQEVAQPPLYYAVAALVSSPIADDDLPELFWHNPQFGYQAGGTVNDNKNMLIHTAGERFPWRGTVLAVRVARLVSLVFGLLAVGATYGLAREALPEQPLLVLATAGVVAFTPQFLFISGVVSNDSAAAAACTAALWALARIIRRGRTPRRAAVAGLALGLALLSKTSALLLLPMGLLALWAAERPEHSRRAAQRPEQMQRTVERPEKMRRNGSPPVGGRWGGEAALMLSLALAVGGWWYVRNWIMFDDPLGLKVHVNTPWGRAEAVGVADLVSELPQVFRSFWGAFGWGHVELPGYLYVGLGVLVALALVGWMFRLARFTAQSRAGSPSEPESRAVESSSRRRISASAKIYLLAAGWCLVVLVALLRWMQQVEAPHGRLLFPALGAGALLLVVGWSNLISFRGSSLASRYVLFVPVVGLLLLALSVPFAVIRPAFALPRLVSPEEASQGVVPQTLLYGGRARLLGYRVEPESTAVGEPVKVTFCWEAVQSMDQDYTLFIHLLGRDNLRVGERTTYPGQGRFPTSLWPVGRAFCDSYWLDVAPWAPAPELYALEVGLYDAESGWRLPAQDAAGQPAEPPAVGLVRIVADAPPPQPKYPLSYDFGGQIALMGYASSAEPHQASSATLKAGDTLTLTLYWQAIQVPRGDYKVFVHLLDRTGALVAQDDAPPRGGRYPTWAWQPGDLVPDSHQVQLPDERPPGPYHWAVGLYLPDTRERLSVVGPSGPLPDGVVSLEMDRN
jgi:hypothetical protein